MDSTRGVRWALSALSPQARMKLAIASSSESRCVLRPACVACGASAQQCAAFCMFELLAQAALLHRQALTHRRCHTDPSLWLLSLGDDPHLALPSLAPPGTHETHAAHPRRSLTAARATRSRAPQSACAPRPCAASPSPCPAVWCHSCRRRRRTCRRAASPC